MADPSTAADPRPVRRCHEGHRLEEQLWSLAYQLLWPTRRRQVSPRAGTPATRAASPPPIAVPATTTFAQRA